MDLYAQALNLYILRTGATQDDVARAIGVDRSNVSRWLRSKKPTRISKTYHQAIEQLTGYKPGVHCLLEPACPIWSNGKISHTAAAVIELLQQMTPRQQSRMLLSATRITNTGKPDPTTR